VIDPQLVERVEALLPLDDRVKPRKARELREWVLAKCDEFTHDPALRAPVLLHEGLFKWFHEELYPLSVFAAHRYGDREDVLFVPRQDPARDVDAEVREPSKTIHVEITCARDPIEHLRMEHLVAHRRVSVTGGLIVKGTKRTGRQIRDVLEFEEHPVSRSHSLGLIKTAAERKAGPGRYGKSYELLIAVDDWWYEAADAHEVTDFVEREVLTLPLEFDAIHVVGMTERMVVSFPRRDAT
jgi:hypothetical protein